MIAAITFDYWNTLYRASAYARPLRMRFLTDLLAKNRIVEPPGKLEGDEELWRNEWNRG